MERKECIESVEEYFDNICRICLKTNNFFPIFSTQLDGIEAKILFEFCLSLEIDEHHLKPKNLCENCLMQLNDFYYFKKRSHENDISFNNLIISKQEEIIVENNHSDQSFLENCPSEETQPSDYKNENNFHEIITTASSGNESCDEIKDLTFVDHSYTSPPFIPGQSDLMTKFKCDHCSKQYSKSGSLYQHWRRNPHHRSAEKTIETKRIKIECSEPVHQSEKISKTKKKKHQPSKKIECPTCNEEFKTIVEKRAHQKEWGHKTRPCTCSICGKVCLSSFRLQSHLRTHSKEKPFQCEQCPKSFAVLYNLKRHEKIHTGEKPYLCELCGQSFNQKVTLQQHSRVHENKTGVRTGEGNETQLKNSQKFMCEVCGQVSKTKSILGTHMKVHADPEFECSDCGKMFYIKSCLNSHKSVHSNERIFKCKDCGKKFKRVLSLRVHELIHLNKKPYPCKFCGKSFRQTAHRFNHEKIHTGENWFSCNYCNKSFALKGNLTVHTRIHTGEKPYQCSVCEKGFYDSSSMKKHLRTIHSNAFLDDETTK